jgi:hypothetical protein
MDTDPNIQFMLLSHLRTWRDASPEPSFIPPYLRDLLKEQAEIGWNRVLEGWVSAQWAATQ